jgi:PHD/YefM family antitoxin component YafN of YafNO toxin-antitoxin module
MNTTEIRQQIDQYLEQLSSDRLQLVAEFLAYLADKESEEATQELLDIPGFIESFERGRKDIAEGRITNWRTIRTDV